MTKTNEHAKTEKYFMKYYDMSPKEITEFLDYIDKVKEQAIKQEHDKIVNKCYELEKQAIKECSDCEDEWSQALTCQKIFKYLLGDDNG